MKCRRENPNVTEKSSISKDERVEIVKPGRWTKGKCSFKTTHLLTFYLFATFILLSLAITFKEATLYTILTMAAR